PAGFGRMLDAGDIDGDGDVDLLVTTDDYSTGLSLVIVRNDGGGNFNVGSRQTFSHALVGSWVRAQLGDWDQDGDLDAIGYSGGHGLVVLENLAGAFQLGAVDQMWGPYGIGAGTADFDGDGFLDFAGPHAIQYGRGLFHSTLPPTDRIAAEVLDWEGDG